MLSVLTVKYGIRLKLLQMITIPVSYAISDYTKIHISTKRGEILPPPLPTPRLDHRFLNMHFMLLVQRWSVVTFVR